MTTDIQALLGGVLPFWNKLSAAEKAQMAAGTRLRDFAAGSVVTGIRNSCPGMLVVLSGSIRCYILSEEGRDFTLFRLAPGDVCVLSASCLLSRIRFEVVLETECECSVAITNTTVVAEVSKNNVWAENFLYKVLADRFSNVIDAIQNVMFRSLDQRLAAFLLEETKRGSSDLVPLTHEKIALYIGSSRECVSRRLKQFAERQIVESSRGGVAVRDKKALEAML